MKDKEVGTVRKITGELIGGFLLYGIVFSILYNFIYAFISSKISSESLIPSIILAIILQGIAAFYVWRCSIATVFRKRSIDRNDVKTVMRNLMIFTVIICGITTILNFYEVNKELNKIGLKREEAKNYMRYQYKYNNDKVDQYIAESEKVIQETKIEGYTSLVVSQVGLLAAYLAVVPLQKKSILKHAV